MNTTAHSTNIGTYKNKILRHSLRRLRLFLRMTGVVDSNMVARIDDPICLPLRKGKELLSEFGKWLRPRWL